MKKVIKIENLCCPNCAAKIETNINKLDGVESCVVSFLAQKIVVEMQDDKADDILSKIASIAKDVEPDAELTF
ncbi:MAG: heavy-metal-associated domain-containing protein [Clostridia bacterium]|nr:heavy-metal-associated domain-containing protein [Clostridia bacterium]